MAISSAGVGSGLDVNSIVTQLMTIERRPLDLLDTKEAAYQAKLSAYGALRGALSSFQSTLTGLNSVDTFIRPAASVSDASVLTATAGSGATSGSFRVAASQLAQAQSLVAAGQSSASAAIGAAGATTIRIDFGSITGGTLANGTYTGATFTQDASQPSGILTITAANNSLQGIRDAINAANLGVSASIVKDGSAAPYRLVLTSASSGASHAMRLTVTGDQALQDLLAYDPAGTQKLTQATAGQDALLTVNGVSISSASNTVNDAVDGVNMTLLAAGTASVSIRQDSSAAKAAIEAFVKGYNDLRSTLNDLTKFDSKGGKSGPLIGDSVVRRIQTALRSALGNPVAGTGTGALSLLGQAGLSFDRDGVLQLDSGKLAAALQKPDEAAALFASFGRATDSLIKVTGSTPTTKAGSYGVNVTALATQGSLVGSAVAGLTITTGVNDTLNVSVNGVSATVTLAPGAYTAASLASQVQAAINGTPAFSAAGASVAVTESSGILTITSKRYGSASTVSASGNAATSLLGPAPVASAGSDVAGTIQGLAGVGAGQTLKGSPGSATDGLALQISGGVTGDRGTVNFARGYAWSLAHLLDDVLSSAGAISDRTDGINRTIKDLDQQRDTLNRRMTQIEARYRAQFSALDTLVTNMQSTSSFLTQQLAKLPSTTGQSN